MDDEKETKLDQASPDRRSMMKAYAAEKCIPLDFYLNRKEMQEEYRGSIREDVMEAELVLDDVDVDVEEAVAEETLETEGFDEENEEEEELPRTGAVAGTEFEDDPVTCYLKEVSSYPLLTQEREIELAQAIRMGQESLEKMVEEYADQEKVILDLHNKVEKLLCHEKAFPGVRDKILKVIVRTLERAAQDCPDKSHISATDWSRQIDHGIHRYRQTGNG